MSTMSEEHVKPLVPAYAAPIPLPIRRASKELCWELMEATRKFGPFASAHEGLSVILEEFEELKEEVFLSPRKRSVERMRAEAVQLGAMALRFVLDVCSDEEGLARRDVAPLPPGLTGRSGHYRVEASGLVPVGRGASASEDDTLDDDMDPINGG